MGAVANGVRGASLASSRFIVVTTVFGAGSVFIASAVDSAVSAGGAWSVGRTLRRLIGGRRTSSAGGAGGACDGGSGCGK